MTCEWVSTGGSVNHLDLVVLFFILDLAAARPRSLQPGPVDIHACLGTDQVVLLSGDGVLVRHADLFERQEGVDGPADGAHPEILLLGCQPEVQEWDIAKGNRYVEIINLIKIVL